MSDPLIQIPFAGGPDESTADRHVPPGTVVAALNAVYDSDGEYQLRYGYTALYAGLSPITVKRLYSYQAELLLNDGSSLWSVTSANAIFARDSVPSMQVVHQGLFNATTNFQSWAEVVSLGFRVVAWIDVSDNRVRIALYSTTTGGLLVGPSEVTTAGTWVNVQVVLAGTNAIVGASQTSGSSIQALSIDLTALLPTIPATYSATLSDASLTDTSGMWSMAPVVGATTFVCAFFNGSVVTSATLRRFDTTMTALTTAAVATGATGARLALAIVATLADNAWLVTAGTTLAAVCAVNPTTLVIVAAATAMTLSSNLRSTTSVSVTSVGVARIDSSHCVAVLNIVTVGGYPECSYQQFSTTAATAGSIGGTTLYTGVSAPVFIGGTALMMMRSLGQGGVSSDPLYPGSYYLVDLLTTSTSTPVKTPQLIALLAPQIVNPAQGAATLAMPQIVAGAIANTYEIALPIVRGSAGRQGLELFTLTAGAVGTSSPSLWTAAPLGKELYLSGSFYDGNRVTEIGLARPTAVPVNVAGTGATYQYCVTWARIDAQGNLEESAPSTISLVTSGTTANTNTVVSCLHVTQKQRVLDVAAVAGRASPIFAVLYRTPNLANGDTTLYRVNKEPFPLGNENSLATPTITIGDTTTDAALTDGTHPVLYTVSGELPHNAPETFTHIVQHKDRIWGIGADQRTIWLSQSYSDGVLPAFNAVLTFSVDDAGEPLTALASLYDRLFIFTASRVYVVYGDGPSIAGTGNDLTQPQQVPTASGCIDPRSIVRTPLGILYQSRRGLELLDTGMNPSFIGQPVSVTTALYPICTSAVMVEANSVVRFTFVTTEASFSSTGRLVQYDFRRQRWSVHSLLNNVATALYDAGVCAATWNPTYGYVEAHTVFGAAQMVIARENTGADANPWLDLAGVYPTMSVTTAWIKSGDLQGWQRVRRVYLLARYYDQNSVSVAFAYDYRTAIVDTHVFSNTTVNSIISGNWEQVRIIPVMGRCESIQVTIAVTAPAFANLVTSGRAAGLSGLAFEVRQKQGGMRDLPAAARS